MVVVSLFEVSEVFFLWFLCQEATMHTSHKTPVPSLPGSYLRLEKSWKEGTEKSKSHPEASCDC